MRCAEDVTALRISLDSHGGRGIRIIARSKTGEESTILRTSLRLADGIMVARGDMGVEIEYERLPGCRKS